MSARTAKARDSRGRLARTALAAALLASLGVFHVWTRTRVLAAGYQLGQAAEERKRLSSEQDRLRIEVESLRSPLALEPYARTRLGMAPPAPGTVWAAGPRFAAGGAGVDGVGHRSGPAEPSSSNSRAAAAAGRAAAPSGAAARATADSGEPVALRGPLRAGRTPRLAR
jgi:cell division protein FtsL